MFARVYWTVFSGTLGDEEALQVVLLVAGSLTALVGALMAFGQRHLKRMLAFVTVSHVGLFLIGIALLDAGGLAGTTLFVVADGMVKASLFVWVGRSSTCSAAWMSCGSTGARARSGSRVP